MYPSWPTCAYKLGHHLRTYLRQRKGTEGSRVELAGRHLAYVQQGQGCAEYIPEAEQRHRGLNLQGDILRMSNRDKVVQNGRTSSSGSNNSMTLIIGNTYIYHGNFSGIPYTNKELYSTQAELHPQNLKLFYGAYFRVS